MLRIPLEDRTQSNESWERWSRLSPERAAELDAQVEQALAKDDRYPGRSQVRSRD